MIERLFSRVPAPREPPASTPRTAPFLAVAGLVATLSAGCGTPSAMGEANSLIVVMPDPIWREVEDVTYQVLEPTIFTTREEKQYQVTQIDPSAPSIAELKLFRNVIVSGGWDDPAMREVAETGGVDLTDLRPGRVFQVRDVWARGQMVTAVFVRENEWARQWERALPSLLHAIDSSYREWVRTRMFATGADTALAADLGRRFGFTITVPRVYDHVVREGEDGDSLVILRNDNPDPSQLIRSLLIDWGPRVDSLTAERALEWRASIDDVHYNVAQGIDDSNSTVTRFQIDGRAALEVTGAWRDVRGDFPAGGPFMVWMVDCPTRTYYIDAWLYAPNDPKYEYILQLQDILGSFRCVLTGS